MNIVIIIDIAKSPRITLRREKALELIGVIKKHIVTKDLDEAERIIKNFNEYYERSRRRFEEYISLARDMADIIKGNVAIQKLKLFIEDKGEYVELVFDRRISVDFLHSCLKEIGFSSIEVIDQSRS
ncbi:MAG: hypothetical protein QXP02_00185 [Desulfurococcaceae archaeon]